MKVCEEQITDARGWRRSYDVWKEALGAQRVPNKQKEQKKKRRSGVYMKAKVRGCAVSGCRSDARLGSCEGCGEGFRRLVIVVRPSTLTSSELKKWVKHVICLLHGFVRHVDPTGGRLRISHYSSTTNGRRTFVEALTFLLATPQDEDGGLQQQRVKARSVLDSTRSGPPH